MNTNSRASEIINRHADRLLAQAGVSGIAESRRHDKPCLLIYISEDSESLRRKLPLSVEGMPVYCEVQASIQAGTAAGQRDREG